MSDTRMLNGSKLTEGVVTWKYQRSGDNKSNTLNPELQVL